MPSKLHGFFLAGLITALSVSPGPPAAGPAAVELALEPGQETTQVIRLGWLNGGANPRSKQISLTLRLRTLDRPAAGGGAWLEVTGTELKYSETGAKRSWPDYDSTSAEGPPPAHLPYEGTAFTALFGQTVQVAFDADGRPQELDGWEGAFESMIASFRTMETVSEDEVARRRAGFPEYILRSVFGILRPSLPGRPVGPGDSWSDRRDGEQGSAELTYTVEKIDEEMLALEVQGAVRGQFSSGGAIRGTSELERSSGWMIGADLRLESRGSFTHTVRVLTQTPWHSIER
ncbi:hypothetical protein ABI59_17085 [Acidobacteria bacterium Mor1]|nr:hypothetical protein ABI59_17085 [Acidobacteria bacterium Mor1]